MGTKTIWDREIKKRRFMAMDSQLTKDIEMRKKIHHWLVHKYDLKPSEALKIIVDMQENAQNEMRKNKTGK